MDSPGFANRPGSARRRISAAAALLLATLALSSCNDDNYCCVSVINVPNSIAIADVNGDGIPDLLVATTANQGFYDNPGFANVILNSKGSPGTFSAGVHYPSTGYNPASIAVGNLTGPGSPDLVIASITGNVSIYRPGSTPGTFQPAVNLVTGGAPNQVVIADVDGDGAPDLVLADFSASGSVIVLYQDPTHPGQFLRAGVAANRTDHGLGCGCGSQQRRRGRYRRDRLSTAAATTARCWCSTSCPRSGARS